MATYSFSPSAASSASGELISSTQRLQQSLDQLMQAVNAFTVANAGQAPDQYAVAQRQWNQGQQQMRAALANGQHALDSIQQDYISADRSSAAAF